MSKNESPGHFDGVAEPANPSRKARLFGSARLTYTICAFFAMIAQMCLRNTLNLVILCMVKQEPNNNATTMLYFNENCGPGASDDSTDGQRNGSLIWTRSQEFHILGAFYFGYLITLPIAGILADKFGGRLLFIHSITIQALVFMLIPIFAEISYIAAFFIRIVQGLIAGCSNPALYQLFSIWAHPTERTAFLSAAYAGFSVGSLIVFPISSYLCSFGWKVAFYIVGSVSLLFGICLHWLVYSTLEEHPRLSKEEYDYLKASQVKTSTEGVPWKSIVKSVPVYAFVFTHAFHIYGIMVFTLLLPRFFKEAMGLPMHQVGVVSATPFVGSIISKIVAMTLCSYIEQMPNINLTRFRRIIYVVCNFTTIIFILGIIFSTCKQSFLVGILSVCIGISTDMAFSGAYWPSLLYVAPAFAGLICGIANSLATLSSALAPIGISLIVHHGAKEEWNIVMCTLTASYILGATVYGLFGSSKLADWGNGRKNNNAA